MPRVPRRIAPAAIAYGVGLLAMLLAIALTTTLSLRHTTITGLALAADEPGPTVRNADAGATPGGSAAPGTATSAAGKPPPTVNAPPARPPGSILLAHGGSATLERRDVGTDGVLPIPSSLRRASWWGAGLHDPVGATVLAGHVNWHGATGPFAELWKSKTGDSVLLTDQAGQTTTYHVSQVITLAKDELPKRADQLFSQDGPHRLVLVTCGGQWVGGKIGYAANQIVIATL